MNYGDSKSRYVVKIVYNIHTRVKNSFKFIAYSWNKRAEISPHTLCLMCPYSYVFSYNTYLIAMKKPSWPKLITSREFQ